MHHGYAGRVALAITQIMSRASWPSPPRSHVDPKPFLPEPLTTAAPHASVRALADFGHARVAQAAQLHRLLHRTKIELRWCFAKKKAPAFPPRPSFSQLSRLA